MSLKSSFSLLAVAAVLGGALLTWNARDPDSAPMGRVDRPPEPTNPAAHPPAAERVDASPEEATDWPRSESDLRSQHLQKAPRHLQLAAADLFRTQADHFRAKASEVDEASRTRESSLAQLDDRFSERLRRACIERLENGDGLLVISGDSYQHRVAGKKHLLWAGGASYFGIQAEVLVVLDPPDEELERIERSFLDMRAVMLAELLIPFNATSLEQRAKAILAFKKLRAAGPVRESWFGIPPEMLKHVMVDEQNWCVLPVPY